MNTATLRFLSEALHRHVTYNAVLPDPEFGKGPFPVLYQLHGLTDDHTGWLYLSNITRHLRKWPLITIFPDGDTSFYLNFTPRARYEDFIIHDLSKHVANTFNVKEGKAALGGLSMGGYGTLHLGLKYPERFASIWAHSSAAFTANDFREKFEFTPQDLEDADLFALAERQKGVSLPKISFDCGTEDFLIENNRSFHKHLTSLGIEHSYYEHPGAHEWDYWDEHVQEAIAQHVAVFGLKPMGAEEQ